LRCRPFTKPSLNRRETRLHIAQSGKLVLQVLNALQQAAFAVCEWRVVAVRM
jgi:hypothetical protein